MIQILSIKPDFFGLNINDSCLKVAKVKKKRNLFEVVSFKKEDLDEGIIKGGAIQNQEELAAKIKKVVSKVEGKKLMTKYACVSLPEEKTFSQVIQLPKMELEELKSAVFFEAENYIPLPLDQMYLDFKIVNSSTPGLDHLDVFLVAVEKNIVDSYILCLKKAGVIPLVLEPETQALARMLVEEKTNLEPVVLLDFGLDKTTFILFSGDSIRFTACIDISYNDLVKTLSKELGISDGESYIFLEKYGIGVGKPAYRAKAVRTVLENSLKDFIGELKKYLDFYLDHDFHEHFLEKESKKRKIEKIILTGEGATLKGMEDFLSKESGLKVETPFLFLNSRIKIKKGLINKFKKNILSFVPALGLSIREINDFF